MNTLWRWHIKIHRRPYPMYTNIKKKFTLTHDTVKFYKKRLNLNEILMKKRHKPIDSEISGKCIQIYNYYHCMYCVHIRTF